MHGDAWRYLRTRSSRSIESIKVCIGEWGVKFSFLELPYERQSIFVGRSLPCSDPAGSTEMCAVVCGLPGCRSGFAATCHVSRRRDLLNDESKSRERSRVSENVRSVACTVAGCSVIGNAPAGPAHLQHRVGEMLKADSTNTRSAVTRSASLRDRARAGRSSTQRSGHFSQAQIHVMNVKRSRKRAVDGSGTRSAESEPCSGETIGPANQHHPRQPLLTHIACKTATAIALNSLAGKGLRETHRLRLTVLTFRAMAPGASHHPDNA